MEEGVLLEEDLGEEEVVITVQVAEELMVVMEDMEEVHLMIKMRFQFVKELSH